MKLIQVINLASSIERAENIKSQLVKITEDWELFPAINGKKNNHELFTKYDDRLSQKYRGKSLSRGQLGCYASHYLLWEKCVAENKPIIILEDDALLDKELLSSFINNLEELPETIECVRLFENKRKNYTHQVKIKLEQYSIDRFSKGHMSTTGYYITPTAAKKFITHSEKWAFAVDIFMDRYWANDVIVYGTVPPCVTNDPRFDSDIGYPNSRVKRSRLSTIKREFFNFKEFIQKSIFNLKN